MELQELIMKFNAERRLQMISLKKFWRSKLMDKNISYQYFLNQKNGFCTMQPEVREAIEKFING